MRVHIDRVEELGDFLELEVVLRPDQIEDEGKQSAEELLKELGIGKNHLMARRTLTFWFANCLSLLIAPLLGDATYVR